MVWSWQTCNHIESWHKHLPCLERSFKPVFLGKYTKTGKSILRSALDQSDRKTAGLGVILIECHAINKTRYGPPFSTFPWNRPFFKFPLFWRTKFSQLDKIFILSYTLILDKRFVNIRTTYQTTCRLCKKLIFVSKKNDAINKRFIHRVTQSVLEIRSPHFYARPYEKNWA